MATVYLDFENLWVCTLNIAEGISKRSLEQILTKIPVFTKRVLDRALGESEVVAFADWKIVESTAGLPISIQGLLRSAGIETEQVYVSPSGKVSADITIIARIIQDVLTMKQGNLVICTGDFDFRPIVETLKRFFPLIKFSIAFPYRRFASSLLMHSDVDIVDLEAAGFFKVIEIIDKMRSEPEFAREISVSLLKIKEEGKNAYVALLERLLKELHIKERIPSWKFISKGLVVRQWLDGMRGKVKLETGQDIPMSNEEFIEKVKAEGYIEEYVYEGKKCLRLRREKASLILPELKR